MSRGPGRMSGSDTLFAAAIIGAGLVVVGLWASGQLASLLTGRGWASGGLTAGIRAALQHHGEPAAAWRSEMPGPGTYWAITIVTVTLILAAITTVVLVVRSRTTGHAKGLAGRQGMAEPNAIAERVGRRNLTTKSRVAELRPTLTNSKTKVRPEQLGWKWGTARGVQVWTSVRDAVVLLGPSGAGKGVYVVIPRVLDAPGPVVVTSTRPDVLTTTLTTRAKVGPVGVISADGSVGDLAETVKWSPIRGCSDGRIATARAQVLAAGSSAGVEDANFWQGWTEKVIKALLHAAALADKGIDDLWRWSQSAPAAQAAVTILDHAEQNPTLAGQVEVGWAATLAEVVDGDEKFRGNVWAGVGRALAGLDLAAVRRRFDPQPGTGFDPSKFLAANGTLYLLAEEDDPASRLLQCLVDDITRVAKTIADRSPRGRLDPPLTLMLDEIANFAPLPKLPVFVSAYGGAGIVTFVVIQSRQQMNRTWGAAAAEAIWDAATIKGILGGITSADDLRDFSAITGEREETTWTASTGHNRGSGLLGVLGSGDTYSEQNRTHPVLQPGEIRGLPEGTALVFYKGLNPMLVNMIAYYRRKDAAAIREGAARVERRVVTSTALCMRKSSQHHSSRR